MDCCEFAEYRWTWSETNNVLLRAPVNIDQEAYFTSMDDYYRKHHIPPPQFDMEELDAKWGRFEHLKYPSSFQHFKWKDVLSKAFQIGGDYSWRLLAPYKRFYSRPGLGEISMPLEHFKAELRPKPHRFLVVLFKNELKCTPAQFSPNSIRLILWFIATYNQTGQQPTFRAFFSIFSVKKSAATPFYEFFQCNRNTKIGIASKGFKPVGLPKSIKHWKYEYIIMSGDDWGYMPGFSVKCEPR